jgi:hypothetical protein
MVNGPYFTAPPISFKLKLFFLDWRDTNSPIKKSIGYSSESLIKKDHRFCKWIFRDASAPQDTFFAAYASCTQPSGRVCQRLSTGELYISGLARV